MPRRRTSPPASRRPAPPVERRYWLLKSEPDGFSFDDLWRAPGRRTGWDGVRNYQARNLLRDAVQLGDGVLFYHSSANPSGIAGLAEVSGTAVPDPTQFDPRSDGYDPAATRAAPPWVQVEVRAVARAPRFLALDELRAVPELRGMALLRPGQRLSVQPVTPAEWAAVLRLLGLSERAVRVP